MHLYFHRCRQCISDALPPTGVANASLHPHVCLHAHTAIEGEREKHGESERVLLKGGGGEREREGGGRIDSNKGRVPAAHRP